MCMPNLTRRLNVGGRGQLMSVLRLKRPERTCADSISREIALGAADIRRDAQVMGATLSSRRRTRPA